MAAGKTYVVEHLDPELGPWSTLEYVAIATEALARGSSFVLSGLDPACRVPAELACVGSFRAEPRAADDVYSGPLRRSVCLLDPAADEDLCPADGDRFDVFLFGGILGE